MVGGERRESDRAVGPSRFTRAVPRRRITIEGGEGADRRVCKRKPRSLSLASWRWKTILQAEKRTPMDRYIGLGARTCQASPAPFGWAMSALDDERPRRYISYMDLDALAKSWRRRGARRRVRRLERAERARQAARGAAALLRKEFDVDEVWLFGSLASEPRHDAFDIDLAVRGLRPEKYFSALARVSEVVNGPVDLITLETCSARVRRAVATTGERIDDQ